MVKHKYIRKYLSKNGKWVYVYSDSAKKETSKKNNGYVGLADLINARKSRAQSINKARDRIANKALRMTTAKARRAYSDCKRRVEAYQKHPGFNGFIQKVTDTAISKANDVASTFGFGKKSKFSMTLSQNPTAHGFNVTQNSNVNQEGAGVHITAHPKPKNTNHQPTRRKRGSKKTNGSVITYAVRAGKQLYTPKKHKRKTTQVFGNSHGGHSVRPWNLI